MSSQTKNEYITFSNLKERSCFSSCIQQLLGEPDATKTNPRFKKAAPMRLYEITRVEYAEATSEFAKVKASHVHRSQVSLAIATLLEKVGEITITVPRWPLSKVQQATIVSYSSWNFEKAGCASLKSDANFLARITVNFIRHELTDYDDLLLEQFNQVGKELAIALIRQNVLRKISEVYPEYANECETQLFGAGLS